MENSDMHGQWVDRRLAALEPPNSFQPDATRALARFRERRRAYRVRRTRWTWAAIAASVTAGAVFLLAPPRCSGAGCVKADGAGPTPAPAVAFVGPAAVPPAPAPVAAAVPKATATARAPRPAVPTPAPSPAAAPVRSFKESGAALAPITCELFTDYGCPHCATVFLQTIPEFVANYVATGKVKLIHRDFPLPQHPYAKLAARYANAAGVLGYYDAVVTQIFRTQAVWAASGDVGTQVAAVLPGDVMEKLRALVQDDPHLDDTVAADMAIARQDQLDKLPAMVVFYKGKRQVLTPVPPYELLRSYFDDLVTK